MISYMILLFITLVAKMLFNWDGLDKIALAASISGLFFAFADYFNWRLLCEEKQHDLIQGVLSQMITSSEKYKTYLSNKLEENMEILSIIGTGYTPEHPFYDTIEYIKQESSILTEHINNQTTSKEQSEELSKHASDVYIPKINRWKNNEMKLLILGFVLSFVVLVFNSAYTFLSALGSIVTVFSFLIILLTYFLKDIYEDKDIKTIENAVNRMKQTEKKLEDIILHDDDKNMKEELKRYIYIIKTGEHMERKHTKCIEDKK